MKAFFFPNSLSSLSLPSPHLIFFFSLPKSPLYFYSCPFLLQFGYSNFTSELIVILAAILVLEQSHPRRVAVSQVVTNWYQSGMIQGLRTDPVSKHKVLQATNERCAAGQLLETRHSIGKNTNRILFFKFGKKVSS